MPERDRLADTPQATLSALLDQYMEGQLTFWPFHKAFMDVIMKSMEDCEAPFDARCQALDDMYEAVYMGQPGATSGPNGLRSESELKLEISRLRSAAGV